MESITKHCLTCGKILTADWPYILREKSFCNRTCGSVYRRKKRPEAFKECLHCHTHFRTNPAYVSRRPNQKMWFCKRSCFTEHKRLHPSIRIEKGGYIRVGHKRQHRVIMEAFLGRKLERKEHVHHKNGNKSDNRLENLEVLDEAYHHTLHSRPKSAGITQTCIRCGQQQWRPKWRCDQIAEVYGLIPTTNICGACGSSGRKTKKEIQEILEEHERRK